MFDGRHRADGVGKYRGEDRDIERREMVSDEQVGWTGWDIVRPDDLCPSGYLGDDDRDSPQNVVGQTNLPS